MQKCIASFETLAQMAIRYIFSRSSPGFRFPLRIPSLTDSMELDLSHLSGDRNEEADALSRWAFVSEPPFNHALHNLFRISLHQLWHPETSVSLHPPDTFLSWEPP